MSWTIDFIPLPGRYSAHAFPALVETDDVTADILQA